LYQISIDALSHESKRYGAADKGTLGVKLLGLDLFFCYDLRSNIYRYCGAWQTAVGTMQSMANRGVYITDCHQEN
jgi:hypothetical protein